MECIKYKLKELLTIKNGKDHKALDNGIYPVFGSGGIMRYADSYLYDQVSILLPRKGTLSNIQFIKGTPFWTVDTTYYTVINEAKANPYYLWAYLNSLDLSGYDSGASIPSMTSKTYYSLNILLPDVATQEKIASILSAYDELIENNNKRIKILEQMAENLYKEWFVRFRFPGYETAEFENGIPQGWEYYTADELYGITIGKTPDRKIFEYFSNEELGNYKWVSISDIGNSNIFVNDTKEYLTEDAVKNCNMITVPKGTILLSFKLTVGKVAITRCSMCTNEAIAHFNINDDKMREYTYLFLHNFEYSKLGNTSSIGTAVNSKIIKKMKIMIPTDEVLEKFHCLTKDIFDTIALLTEQGQNLSKQRDLLLPRLMSGKLEVKSELLTNTKSKVIPYDDFVNELGMAARAKTISDNDLRAMYEAYIDDDATE